MLRVLLIEADGAAIESALTVLRENLATVMGRPAMVETPPASLPALTPPPEEKPRPGRKEKDWRFYTVGLAPAGAPRCAVCGEEILEGAPMRRKNRWAAAHEACVNPPRR